MIKALLKELLAVQKDKRDILKERKIERKAWKRLFSTDANMIFLSKLCRLAEIQDRSMRIVYPNGTILQIYDPMMDEKKEPRLPNIIEYDGKTLGTGL